MAATILKNTNQEVVVKVTGVATTAIALTDLTAATQELVEGGTPTVNIVSANWTGLPGSTITVSRGATVVLPIAGDQPQNLDFTGQGYVENTANTSDFSVVIGTANAALYLVLRKVSGWATKVENATYGAYDDPTQVGA